MCRFFCPDRKSPRRKTKRFSCSLNPQKRMKINLFELERKNWIQKYLSGAKTVKVTLMVAVTGTNIPKRECISRYISNKSELNSS